MGTVLDHVRETNSLGYSLLQADKYKPLVQLFGAMNYDPNNQAMVALGDHFTSAMTGFGIRDSFAMPLANALQSDKGLQGRIVALAADPQGIALLDTAVTQIENGGDVENAVNAQYSQRFGQQKLAATKPLSADPAKRPKAAGTTPVPGADAGGFNPAADAPLLPPDMMAALMNFFQPILDFFKTFFDRSGIKDTALYKMFDGGAPASNEASGAGPKSDNGLHPSVEVANNAFRESALSHSVNDVEIAKTDKIMQKDGKTPAVEHVKNADGLYTVTLHMPNGTTEHWKEGGLIVNARDMSNNTSMAYFKLNDDGKTISNGADGKPQLFYTNVAGKDLAMLPAQSIAQTATVDALGIERQIQPNGLTNLKMHMQDGTTQTWRQVAVGGNGDNVLAATYERMKDDGKTIYTGANGMAQMYTETFDGQNKSQLIGKYKEVDLSTLPIDSRELIERTQSGVSSPSLVPSSASGKLSGNPAALRVLSQITNGDRLPETAPAPQQAGADTRLTIPMDKKSATGNGAKPQPASLQLATAGF